MERLDSILLNRDWQALKELEWGNKKTLRLLMNKLYLKDGQLFWPRVEALGIAAAFEEKHKKDASVELVRRYFWSLNEESGGNAWNAAEAIGSIMAYNPKECGHFNWMYANLLDDENLQAGVLWGLLNLAINAPEIVEPLWEKVRPFLEAENPDLRGLAVWIVTLMKDYPAKKESWEIEARLAARLAQDKSLAEIYLEGKYYQFPIAELLKKEVLAFSTRKFKQGDFIWEVTTATSPKGLCWVGLGLGAKNEAELRKWAQKHGSQALILPRDLPNQNVMNQLAEYFNGSRKEFTLTLNPRGTDFQLKVWEELRQIPYGETRSYSEIAKRIGNPKGQRAVGMANNKNPIGIIIPCHRVVGKNGDLVGYAGGLEYKERLLALEAF